MYGEKKVWQTIKKDAETNGSPLQYIIENYNKEANNDVKDVEYRYVNGLYEDGMPWNGVLAKANVSHPEKIWAFVTVSGGDRIRKVTDFVKEFEIENN